MTRQFVDYHPFRSDYRSHGSRLDKDFMNSALRDSYRTCRDLARRAGNFYYAFLTLPKDQFWAMCALYGFTRLVDDAGDDPHASTADRTKSLQKWRDNLKDALQGDDSASSVLPALIDTIRKYHIPPEYLYSLIDGVELDLNPVHYQTYEELARYSYHVAGVIGLCCIHVWGFSDSRAKTFAITLGEAFQLTNILRDLKEDNTLGRCYLPVEDMREFGYTQAELAAGTRNDAFQRLMQFEVQRARKLYRAADELEQYLNPIGASVLQTMVKLYRGILDEIERRQFDVFSRRVRLSRWTKLRFAFSGILRRYWRGARHVA